MTTQDEPFGYFRPDPFGWTDCDKSDEGAVALYERPQPSKREPLTYGQILRIAEEATNDANGAVNWSMLFARAIERAHGIGGQA